MYSRYRSTASFIFVEEGSDWIVYRINKMCSTETKRTQVLYMTVLIIKVVSEYYEEGIEYLVVDNCL